MSSVRDAENDRFPTEQSPLLEKDVAEIITEVANRVPRHVPSRSRKLVVLVSCLWVQALTCGLGFGLAVMFVELKRVFAATYIETALVETIYFAVLVLGGFAFVRSVTKYGPGPCTMIATIVASIGFILNSFVSDLTTIIIFVGAVSGLGSSVCYLSSYVTVSSIFNTKTGTPLLVLVTGSAVGQCLFPFFYEILISKLGWRGCFLIMGAIALNCFPAGVIMYTSRKFYHSGSNFCYTESVVRKHDKSDMEHEAIHVFDVSLLKDPVLLLLLFNCLLIEFSGMTEAIFIVDVMVTKGYERKTGSFLLLLTGIGNLVGRILPICLRQVSKQCVPTVCHWIYAFLLVSTSHTLIAIFDNYWTLFAASLLYGVSIGIVLAQTPSVICEAARVEQYPMAFALMNFTFGLGMVMCGVVGGLIKDTNGNYNILFDVAAVVSIFLAISSILMTYVARKTRKQTTKSDHEDLSPLISQYDGRVDRKYLRLTNRRGTVF